MFSPSESLKWRNSSILLSSSAMGFSKSRKCMAALLTQDGHQGKLDWERVLVYNDSHVGGSDINAQRGRSVLCPRFDCRGATALCRVSEIRARFFRARHGAFAGSHGHF